MEWLFFILIMDGLRDKWKNACIEAISQRLLWAGELGSYMVFFVDGIFAFGMISKMIWATFHNIFYKFGSASRLLMNKGKLILLFGEGQQEDIEHIANLFGVEDKPISSRLKYLGFSVKPDNYSVNDWVWIVDKFHIDA